MVFQQVATRQFLTPFNVQNKYLNLVAFWGNVAMNVAMKLVNELLFRERNRLSVVYMYCV